LKRKRNRKPAAPVSPNVLVDAERLTAIERQAVYGHPLEDYICVSTMQQALLEHAGGKITPILSQQFQICVKLARLAKSPAHRDSMCDIAGYARTMEMSVQKIIEEHNKG
jgi:hypothetical protein